MTTKVSLDVRPLTPTIGAEIRGVDCAAPLDDDTIAAIRSVWLDHLVVFFPGQELSDDTQRAFAARFGEPTVGHPVEKTVANNPSIQPIDSVKDRTNFWHTDVTFMSRPPMASLLRAVVIPESGGDTMWADTRAAYDALAEPFKHFCDDLVAIHYDPYYAALVDQGEGNEWEGKKLTKLMPAFHPVVRVHPETGRRNLFVNPQFTVALQGFPGPQGAALLKVLYDHMTQPEYIVRYHWTPGTLAMWDNRTTMHFGIYDYGDARRIMHRVILRGERPAGIAGVAEAA
ncbi:MAG TPA: TauD/TfdA family dioxygenase [Acidimicrobiia bacterium]|jgi:taurine dioxygenase